MIKTAAELKTIATERGYQGDPLVEDCLSSLAHLEASISRAPANAPAQPVEPASKLWIFGTLGSLAVAIGLLVWGIELSHQVSNDQALLAKFEQAQQESAKQFADLQAKTNSVLSASGESSKDAASKFTSAVDQYSNRLATLTAENEKLKRDLAAAQTPQVNQVPPAVKTP